MEAGSGAHRALKSALGYAVADDAHEADLLCRLTKLLRQPRPLALSQRLSGCCLAQPREVQHGDLVIGGEWDCAGEGRRSPLIRLTSQLRLPQLRHRARPDGRHPARPQRRRRAARRRAEHPTEKNQISE
eukprot:scaffold177270_cov30-Tisochrysis_lutea.AAC.4